MSRSTHRAYRTEWFISETFQPPDNITKLMACTGFSEAGWNSGNIFATSPLQAIILGGSIAILKVIKKQQFTKCVASLNALDGILVRVSS